MNSTPDVTVYITCSNYGLYLSKAVESVLGQLYEGWELFIIDDGSADNTAAVAQAYVARFPDRIQFIRHESPQGLQRIANHILQRAGGSYILRLDADDWLDESALLVLVKRALQDDKPGLVYGNFYYVDTNENIIGIERNPKLWDEDKSGNIPPHGACTLVSVRSLKAVGGYSEDIDAQDGWELWFKLVGRISMASVETPVFFYRQHNSSLSRSSSRLYNARAKIFSKLREKISGSYAPSILAVIPVKESYPHIEGVPYIEINGKSLLERAIQEAQAVSTISQIMVASESGDVLEHSKFLEKSGKVKQHLRHLRQTKLQSDHIHPQSILKEAGEAFRNQNGYAPDIVLFLSLHAVFRPATAIAKAVDVLLVTESDTVVSVVEVRDPIFMHSEKGLKLIGNGRFDSLLYREEQLFRFNGSVIASWWDVVDEGAIWGEKVGYIEMTREESFQIVDKASIAQVGNLHVNKSI